jgi:serine protease
MRHALSVVAMVCFVACQTPIKPPVYGLTGLLPSPALPGELVTALGQFPAKAQVALDGVPQTAFEIPDGFRLTVPRSITAGEHTLSIIQNGKVILSGILPVTPIIESASLDGGRLRVSGLGWNSTTANRLITNGLSLDPQVENGTLVAELPSATAYGQMAISLSVDGRVSAPFVFDRQAGTLVGTVSQPGLGGTALVPKASLQIKSTAQSATTVSSSLIVFADLNSVKQLGLPGLKTISTLKVLNASRLNFSDHQKAQDALIVLRASSAVHAVEWNTSVQLEAVSTNALALKPQAGSISDRQWHLELQGIRQAWNVSQGAGVRVAVIDTGVQLDHPDLQANLIAGYDFVDLDGTPEDQVGHGTHVAGLIAANGGALGVAPAAKIQPIRVLRDLSGGTAFAVAQGILYAANQLDAPINPTPAQVINLSLGSNQYSQIIAAAIQKALEQDVIVIAAAGNDGGPVAYPANLPGVIAVTSLAGPVSSYQPYYANRGNSVWLTAFGGDNSQDQNKDGTPDGILSTDLRPALYSTRQGTSMASPQVAGLAALAIGSGIKPNFVKQTLAATAGDLGYKGFDLNFGHGLISGRVTSSKTPRTYVLTVDSLGKVIAFAPVLSDGSYRLQNLHPGVPVSVLAASDDDNDAILGESGEFVSPLQIITLSSAETKTLNFNLDVSDGQKPYPLQP